MEAKDHRGPQIGGPKRPKTQTIQPLLKNLALKNQTLKIRATRSESTYIYIYTYTYIHIYIYIYTYIFYTPRVTQRPYVIAQGRAFRLQMALIHEGRNA